MWSSVWVVWERTHSPGARLNRTYTKTCKGPFSWKTSQLFLTIHWGAESLCTCLWVPQMICLPGRYLCPHSPCKGGRCYSSFRFHHKVCAACPLQSLSDPSRKATAKLGTTRGKEISHLVDHLIYKDYIIQDILSTLCDRPYSYQPPWGGA